jgi:hypothetical protein
VRLIHIRLRSPSFQEEGEEDVAYHQGAGHEEAHIESGLLYQSLNGEEASGGEGVVAGSGGAAQLTGERLMSLRKCLTAPGKSLSTAEHYSVCLRFVSFLGNLIAGAKKFLKNASKTVVKAAKKIISWVKKHYAEVHEVDCLVQGIGTGTLVGAGATALSDGIGVYAAGTIGGTAGAAVTYACEHE